MPRRASEFALGKPRTPATLAAMPHRVEMWRTFRWIGIVAVLLAGTWLLVVRPVQQSMAAAKAGLDRSLDKVLAAITNSDTRIVDGRAEITESSEVAELALLEMKMSAARTFEQEQKWFDIVSKGRKKLTLLGNFRVKAGYKLKPGISLRIENDLPVASFPKAEVLSVELVDFVTLDEVDGWFNDITPEDRAMVLRDLRERMMEEARRSGMLEVVEGTLRTRLGDLLGTREVKLEASLP
jgi:hypothetical protein